VVAGAVHPSDRHGRKEIMMVTPKVNETKRGSAHKQGTTAAAASSAQSQR
jgi:hypothetical protein